MKLLDLFFSARPLLHLPIWSVYLAALKYHNQLTFESFDWGDVYVLAVLSIMAAGAFWHNQIHDFESDALNNKVGFLQRGYLSIKTLRSASILATVLGVTMSFFYSGTLLLICIQGTTLNYLYSAPPLRLKDRPFSGLLANAYAFGFLISVSIQPHINTHTIGLLAWDNPYFFFLAVAAIHIMTTLPDVAGDKRTGKRTIAVVWGRTASLVLAGVIMLTATWVAWYSAHYWLVAVGVTSSLLIISNLFIKSQRLELASAKVPILLLTILAAYFYPFYALFIIALVYATRIYYRKRFGIVYPQIA